MGLKLVVSTATIKFSPVVGTLFKNDVVLKPSTHSQLGVPSETVILAGP